MMHEDAWLEAAYEDRNGGGVDTAVEADEYEDDDEPLECLDGYEGGCAGPVEYRMALSGTGIPYPRCDKHWGERLDRQDEINRRYPHNAPADFDPLYAGEAWGEDDY